MKQTVATLVLITSFGTTAALAQNWPQWRGPARDGHAADFKAPPSWPATLTQKWKIAVGDGVANPAIVGDRIFVFSRQDENEILRCLSLADGRELWQDRYESLGATGPASGFSGPRSTPVVAAGKVVTLGVRGMISCLDAATGKKLWRKDDFHAYPNFHPSSSPLIVDGLAIAQLGGRENGAVVAYDLATGEEKWKRPGAAPSYASPVLISVGGTQLVVAQTESRTIALNASTGALAWESEPAESGGGQGGPAGPGGGRGMGGGRDYKAATPVVDGDTLILAGRGIRALKLHQQGDKFSAKELWSNPDKSVQFSSPILKNGQLYGLTGINELFSLNVADGKSLWSAPFPGANPAPGTGPGNRVEIDGFRYRANASFAGQVAQAQPERPDRPARPEGGPRGPGGPGGPGGRRGGGMGGGGGGYGTIVDAGSVLFALTPRGDLVVFEPSKTEFKPLATYSVGAQTHSYPIPFGSHILIKDKDSLVLWSTR